MIDIHSHILPGVDDGAHDVHEALAMARLAVGDGITHLFATPHHASFGPQPRQEVEGRVARLQASLDSAGIDLTVLPGYEVRLQPDVLEALDHDLAGPLGDSRYLLAEPPFTRYDSEIEQLLFTLFERGYVPVLAHPERIYPIQRDLHLITPFLERGGLTQITSHSLTGYHGQRAREVAELMLRQGLVHIIASDAHHAQRRAPILSDALELAALIVGREEAEMMVTTAPLAIVNDQLHPESVR